MKNKRAVPRRPGGGKTERYLQPSILLALLEHQVHGYELLKELHRFGFIQGEAPPGMVYRHLRQLEEDGLVSSSWSTEEAGPAKRVYAITDEGRGALQAWVGYMQRQADALRGFIARYQDLHKGRREE